jgi:hypothetical protein
MVASGSMIKERRIMDTRLTYLVLGLGIVGLCGLAYAQGTGTDVLKLPRRISSSKVR